MESVHTRCQRAMMMCTGTVAGGGCFPCLHADLWRLHDPHRPSHDWVSTPSAHCPSLRLPAHAHHCAHDTHPHVVMLESTPSAHCPATRSPAWIFMRTRVLMCPRARVLCPYVPPENAVRVLAMALVYRVPVCASGKCCASVGDGVDVTGVRCARGLGGSG